MTHAHAHVLERSSIKITVFFSLLLFSFIRYLVFPDPIEGLSDIEQATLHTALIAGEFIAIFATFIILMGLLRTHYFYLSVLLAFVLYEINLLSMLVYGYIYVFQGEVGLPHEPFPVTKHNMYMTYFFALAAVGLFCLSRAKNIFRTLVVFPVMILGIGMAYYHTYQFFLYSQDALDSLRSESAEYFEAKITEPNFLEYCNSIKNLKCAEFKDGESFPDHLVIESSPVIYELKRDYEEHQYETIRGFKPDFGFVNAWENGQIDDTQSPSFWATITFYRLNGVNRIAVHNFISDVHKASFSASIAFLVIISVWGVMMILLLEKHKKYRHLVSENPKAPWYAFLMLPAIFFVSNLEALQDRFHWYALFLIVFCGGWRFFARKSFYIVAVPSALLITVMTIGTFKPEWVNLQLSSATALSISFLVFIYLTRNEILEQSSHVAIKLHTIIFLYAFGYFYLQGDSYFAIIPMSLLLISAFRIFAITNSKGQKRLNTMFLYMSLFILSAMSIAFTLGVNPYNLSILDQMWSQKFITNPEAQFNHEEKVYAFYVFTFSSLLMFINIILSKILNVHQSLKYR